uniref:Fatty acyl-CoA reductase n=1 Tax=Cajanus cajan TaxID=3821 RepID=A0A151QYT5_CAJCA|nr:putative fatty acyl-CoA reductase 4 [Cajanus cajan]
MGKDLFRVLRYKWGSDFGSFISKKVVVVAGDVSDQNLGIKDKNTRRLMLEELDIIVHSAATTNLNERYDIEMETNTMGAFHVANFAKNCPKLEIVLHVSTAYVCGEAEGLIVEEPLILEKLKELQTHNCNKEEIESEMKSFGHARTMDFVVVNYGKGILTDFVGNLETILDAIPVDMVVNVMIVASMAHSKGLSQNLMYHIGSSMKNPFRITDLVDVMYYYFTKNPCVDKYGKPIVVTKKMNLFSTRLCTKLMIYLRACKYHIPHIFNQQLHKIAYLHFYVFCSAFANILFKHTLILLTFKCILNSFDVKNAENLGIITTRVADMDDRFNFDSKSINWTDYMMNVHFPGLMKQYSVKALSIGSKM